MGGVGGALTSMELVGQSIRLPAIAFYTTGRLLPTLARAQQSTVHLEWVEALLARILVDRTRGSSRSSGGVSNTQNSMNVASTYAFGYLPTRHTFFFLSRSSGCCCL